MKEIKTLDQVKDDLYYCPTCKVMRIFPETKDGKGWICEVCGGRLRWGVFTPK